MLESLHGYLMLAEELLAQHAKFASSYNFGPSDEDVWPVERIATKLVQMWGNGASWIRDAVPSVHEDHVLRLDASKARVELGWKATAQNRSGAGVDDGVVSRLETRRRYGRVHGEANQRVREDVTAPGCEADAENSESFVTFSISYQAP